MWESAENAQLYKICSEPIFWLFGKKPYLQTFSNMTLFVRVRLRVRNSTHMKIDLRWTSIADLVNFCKVRLSRSNFAGCPGDPQPVHLLRRGHNWKLWCRWPGEVDVTTAVGCQFGMAIESPNWVNHPPPPSLGSPIQFFGIILCTLHGGRRIQFVTSIRFIFDTFVGQITLQSVPIWEKWRKT